MEMIRMKQSFKLASLGVAIAILSAGFTPAHGEESNDYIPEIGWDSRITSMGLDKKDNINQKYRFDCQSAPEDLVHAPTWGTRVYTTNSGICTAAVHAGMVNPKKGGKITIKLIKGKKFYKGSNKNKVKSKDHTATKMSFIFVGKPKVEVENSDSNEKKRQPSGLEKVLMEGFQRGVERSIEKVITDVLK